MTSSDAFCNRTGILLYDYHGETRVDDDFLERVESRMHELVEADLSIKKRTVHTDEAIGLFGQYGMYDKEELFRYRRIQSKPLQHQ